MFIERDKKIQKMQLDLDKQLTDIYNQIDPNPVREKNKMGVNFIGVEDALKELMELGIPIH